MTFKSLPTSLTPEFVLLFSDAGLSPPASEILEIPIVRLQLVIKCIFRDFGQNNIFQMRQKLYMCLNSDFQHIVDDIKLGTINSLT